jgi:hypothetical protein
MSGLHGKNGKIVVGSSGVVAEVTDWSVEESADTIDDTAMGPNVVAETHIPSLTSWTGSLSCNYDPTDADGQVVMRAGQSMTAKLYPEGDATGKKYWSGTVTITKMGQSGAVKGKIAASFSFKGNGLLNLATA